MSKHTRNADPVRDSIVLLVLFFVIAITLVTRIDRPTTTAPEIVCNSEDRYLGDSIGVSHIQCGDVTVTILD